MLCQFTSEIARVIMMITIEQALHPLLLTFAILGFGIYLPIKTYLNIFYDLAIWIVYIYLYFYLIIEFKAEWYLEIFIVINTLISIFIIIISIIMNIYYNKVCIYMYIYL